MQTHVALKLTIAVRAFFKASFFEAMDHLRIGAAKRLIQKPAVKNQLPNANLKQTLLYLLFEIVLTTQF